MKNSSPTYILTLLAFLFEATTIHAQNPVMDLGAAGYCSVQSDDNKIYYEENFSYDKTNVTCWPVVHRYGWDLHLDLEKKAYYIDEAEKPYGNAKSPGGCWEIFPDLLRSEPYKRTTEGLTRQQFSVDLKPAGKGSGKIFYGIEVDFGSTYKDTALYLMMNDNGKFKIYSGQPKLGFHGFDFKRYPTASILPETDIQAHFKKGQYNTLSVNSTGSTVEVKVNGYTVLSQKQKAGQLFYAFATEGEKDFYLNNLLWTSFSKPLPKPVEPKPAPVATGANGSSVLKEFVTPDFRFKMPVGMCDTKGGKGVEGTFNYGFRNRVTYYISDPKISSVFENSFSYDLMVELSENNNFLSVEQKANDFILKDTFDLVEPAKYKAFNIFTNNNPAALVYTSRKENQIRGPLYEARVMFYVPKLSKYAIITYRFRVDSLSQGKNHKVINDTMETIFHSVELL